ncbi:MAG: hypothetical protein CVV27_08675 [Candidatus Melainabacteria bacterium HGW-Melainabacteria-1]|nr:MAG: hypothetical protein CVV27_08675 [Candidatus Melainabacteria bacterium HGW-Melainabacteria-1]
MPIRFKFLKVSLVTGLLLASACGKGEDLPNDVMGSLNTGLTSPSASDAEIQKAIPQILDGLEDIKQALKNLRSVGITPVSTSKPSTAKPTSRKPTGSKPTTSKPTSTTKPAVKVPVAEAPSGNEELKKALDLLASKPFIQATVEKTEKHLSEGRVTTGKLVMYTKLPNIVKIDAVYSSTGGSGAKVLYTSSDGTPKVKVRPGGALGFVTTELAKTDDRIDSTNNYPPDQLDFFGMVKRLSSGYKAELIGKTQFNGTSLNILKLTATGANSLDDRINYEYIGYEPDSYKIRLWETFTADSKDPYMRVAITKLDFPASIPDSSFKL